MHIFIYRYNTCMSCVYLYTYVHNIRTNVRVHYGIGSFRNSPCAICIHNIHAYTYTYMQIHTSVDLPMPPGPHSTHLLVVALPLSNQSRMPFSSLDRRWNPFGALILNTRIASTLSPSSRATGAWRALESSECPASEGFEAADIFEARTLLRRGRC